MFWGCEKQQFHTDCLKEDIENFENKNKNKKKKKEKKKKKKKKNNKSIEMDYPFIVIMAVQKSSLSIIPHCLMEDAKIENVLVKILDPGKFYPMHCDSCGLISVVQNQNFWIDFHTFYSCRFGSFGTFGIGFMGSVSLIGLVGPLVFVGSVGSVGSW